MSHVTKSLLKILQVRIATKIDQVNILESGLFRSKMDRWEKVFNLRTKVGTGVLLSYVAFLSLSSSQKESREWKNMRYASLFLPPDYEDVLKLSGCTTVCTRRDLLCAKTFENIKELGSRLHHLMPPTRARAHGCCLRFNDRPSLMKRKTERHRGNTFLWRHSNWSVVITIRLLSASMCVLRVRWKDRYSGSFKMENILNTSRFLWFWFS